jgi:hypothetical protein
VRAVAVIAPVRAFDRRFLAPAPPTRLAALRVLVGAFGTIYLLVRAPYLFDVATLPRARFEPVGILAFLDEPLPLGVVRLGLVAAVLLGVAFTLGWRHRLCAPLYAVLLLAITTYTSSWQHILHTENLLVLHTIVLAGARASAAWSLDARRAGGPEPPPAPGFGWPVRVMSVITVLTYVVAGWAKVRHGGIDWVTGDVLRNQVAHDNLRKIVLGDVHSPIGGWLVRYGWMFPPLAAVSLAVELAAPIALARGRIRTLWVVSAWLFHAGVLALMAILFIYPLTGIAYASMLRPERAVSWIRARRMVPLSTLRWRGP